MREFLGQWGSVVPEDAGDAPLQDFPKQCDALRVARRRVISPIMGHSRAKFDQGRRYRLVCLRNDTRRSPCERNPPTPTP
jgi:hypothetical protein